jgi:hypothetical protein
VLEPDVMVHIFSFWKFSFDFHSTPSQPPGKFEKTFAGTARNNMWPFIFVVNRVSLNLFVDGSN